MTDLSGVSWFSTLASVFFIAVTSTFLGLFIAVSVSEVFEAQTFSNFIRFPMLFLCGLFIPVSQLPVFLRPLAYVLPLTYGADLLKASINSAGHLPVWLNYAVLICFTIFLFSFSITNVQKKWLL